MEPILLRKRLACFFAAAPVAADRQRRNGSAPQQGTPVQLGSGGGGAHSTYEVAALRPLALKASAATIRCTRLAGHWVGG